MIEITGINLIKNKFPDGSMSDFYEITFNDPTIRKSVKITTIKSAIKQGHGAKGEVAYQVASAKRSAIIDSLYKIHGKEWESFDDGNFAFTDAEMALIKLMQNACASHK